VIYPIFIHGEEFGGPKPRLVQHGDVLFQGLVGVEALGKPPAHIGPKLNRRLRQYGFHIFHHIPPQ
jgi:hypothetical protein